MAWFLGNNRSFNQEMFTFGGILPIVIWSAVWTGLALWYAGRRGEKWWFIFFLLVHTAGIAEILYLIFVVKAFSKSKGVSKKKRS